MNVNDPEVKAMALGKALGNTMAHVESLIRDAGPEGAYYILLDHRRAKAKEHGDWMKDKIDLQAMLETVDLLSSNPEEQKKAWHTLRVWLSNRASLNPWEEWVDDEFGKRIFDREE